MYNQEAFVKNLVNVFTKKILITYFVNLYLTFYFVGTAMRFKSLTMVLESF